MYRTMVAEPDVRPILAARRHTCVPSICLSVNPKSLGLGSVVGTISGTAMLLPALHGLDVVVVAQVVHRLTQASTLPSLDLIDIVFHLVNGGVDDVRLILAPRHCATVRVSLSLVLVGDVTQIVVVLRWPLVVRDLIDAMTLMTEHQAHVCVVRVHLRLD